MSMLLNVYASQCLWSRRLLAVKETLELEQTYLIQITINPASALFTVPFILPSGHLHIQLYETLIDLLIH